MSRAVAIAASAALLAALSGCTTIIINTGSGGGSSSGSSSHNLLPWRTSMSFGTWSGSVSETYGTQVSNTNIALAWGGVFTAGMQFGPVFVEWAPTYYGVGKVGTSDGNSNSYYLTLTGFEAGLSLQKMIHLPLEPFIGYDPQGRLGFATGTQSVFDGTALKLGVNAPLFATSPFASLGLRGEARRNFVSLDNAGPVNVGVSSWTYYVGLAFTFAE